MKLLVGLGNPGKKYDRNRHNIGFMAVDEIARAHGFAPWRSRFKALASEGMLSGEKCLLLKPQTFMNLSGEAVQEAVQFYKIDPLDVIVLHDEIDIAAAKIKIKSGGGNAGHNGLKSISQHIGNDYVRLRLGVGRPQQKSQVANFVLKDFSKDDEVWLEEALCSIGRNALKLVTERHSDFIKAYSDDLRDFMPDKKEVTKVDETPRKKNSPPVSSDSKTETDAGSNNITPDSKKQTSSETPRSALEAALNKWLKKETD